MAELLHFISLYALNKSKQVLCNSEETPSVVTNWDSNDGLT